MSRVIRGHLCLKFTICLDIKIKLPLSNVLAVFAFLFKTIVNGACVLEKKHIAIGPNNG